MLALMAAEPYLAAACRQGSRAGGSLVWKWHRKGEALGRRFTGTQAAEPGKQPPKRFCLTSFPPPYLGRKAELLRRGWCPGQDRRVRAAASACTWGTRVGAESGERLEHSTRLKPASIRKGLGWSHDFCGFAARQPFLPAWPCCHFILTFSFAQVALSSECIGPRPRQEPSSPALGSPKALGIFHSSLPAECGC